MVKFEWGCFCSVHLGEVCGPRIPLIQVGVQGEPARAPKDPPLGTLGPGCTGSFRQAPQKSVALVTWTLVEIIEP